MNFSSIRNNLKRCKMPIIQIVIASFLVVFINDKNLTNNIFYAIQNICSPEAVMSYAMDIGKILSLQYLVIFGISYLFIELAKVVSIAITLFAIIKYMFRCEFVEEKKVEIVSAFDKFHTNDLYLQTSKFIC